MKFQKVFVTHFLSNWVDVDNVKKNNLNENKNRLLKN